jgi:acyl-coenzyme A synthetase/AMP-(fatty) acid ligase
VLSEVLHNAGGGEIERGASSGPNDAALVLFTSGTTGEPKGVVHSFGSLAARLSLNTAAIGLKSSDRVLLTLPVHFGHGLIGNALSPMFAGAKLFVPPMGLPLAARLGEIIDEEAITFLTSVPALWRMAMKLSKRPRNGTLRRVHVGSAPASVDFLREIENWAGCEVYNCYGITEAANWISGASVRDPNMRDSFVGQPWGGTASVIDRAGNRQSVGEGEIIIQTPSLMTGYLRRPDLTAEVLFNGWYRTGDWGYVDEQGSMCLQGRIKEEINRAGFKVQPAEIDLLLEKHPEVEEACSFGIPDPVSHEIVAVAVRLTTGSSQTQKSLRAWCLERLRKDAVPERWFFTDEIPKTARGKLRRDAVRRKFVVSGNSNS